ncbi:hypothetical protein MPLA_1800051 [Mesorhizobium sp. ORS 3359]|nr:hypothetical protein MPLA_1800051 [Mesorhizobium sp. ORS 3359]
MPSTLRPRPLGRRTPSGASTRRISALLSAVRSTTTERPISGRSSATTFCIITHCSDVAPAGVSQMIDHAPCVDFTVPLGGVALFGAALAPTAMPTPSKATARTTFAKVLESQEVMTAPLRITAL